MFVCKECSVTKPLEEYHIRKNGGRQGKCRECERAYQKAWTKKDPETYRKRKRESMARRRAADPEAARAYSRDYHHRNREKQIAVMRAYYAKRFFWGRAMKLRGPDKATAREVAALWKAQRGRCALTGRRLDRTAQLDHKTPKARGGGDSIGNLQWLCENANLAKRALTDAEFVALCSEVMAWVAKQIEIAESGLT
jgi:5-methylcytosine-specific restriction endonuclease McrA